MPDFPEQSLTESGAALVEGIARVVAVEGAVAWLEPEQGPSCAGCNLPGLWRQGLGTVASRLAARRFPLAGHRTCASATGWWSGCAGTLCSRPP